MFAVHESWRIRGLRVESDGNASMQYFVQAQRCSSLLSADRVSVMEGCRETMRIGWGILLDGSSLKRVLHYLSSLGEENST